MGIKATGHWTGALTALVALRLAQANNLAAGVAGVGTLTALGIGAGASVAPGVDPQTMPYSNWDLSQWLAVLTPGGALNLF